MSFASSKEILSETMTAEKQGGGVYLAYAWQGDHRYLWLSSHEATRLALWWLENLIDRGFRLERDEEEE